MKRLADQFKAFSEQTAKKLDGPDTVEGGVWVLSKKSKGTGKMTTMPLRRNNNFKF